TGSQVSSQHPLPIALSANGHTIAQALPDHTIQLWDVAAREKRQLLRDHKQVIRVLTFFPDGKTLVSGSPSQGILHWDVASGRSTDFHGCKDMKALAVSSNGRTLVYLDNDHHISWCDHRLGFISGW